LVWFSAFAILFDKPRGYFWLIIATVLCMVMSITYVCPLDHDPEFWEHCNFPEDQGNRGFLGLLFSAFVPCQGAT